MSVTQLTRSTLLKFIKQRRNEETPLLSNLADL